ncbi:MAG TPA: cation:proton antiporter [Allocoleopsis sp.]
MTIINLGNLSNFADIYHTVPLLANTTKTADDSLVLASVLLSLVVIYLASKIGGEICVRLNQPPVLGELIGGVIVGISVLHLLVFPGTEGTETQSLLINFLQTTAGITLDTAQNVFETQREVISILADIGVIILLLEIGLESDLDELIKVGPQAIAVAFVGVILPFTFGTLGLLYIFHTDMIPAVFAGAALTATSIGITAKVLTEINRLSSTEGQIIIGAAVLDDILGIIVLAVVASLAKTGKVELSNVIYLIIVSVVFLVGSIVLGRWLNPYFVKLVDQLKTRGSLLIISLIFAFILAYIANVIHLEAILGSFAAGLILAETEKRKELLQQIVPIADKFVPIFFVVVGAKTDFNVLNPSIPANREGLIIASFLIIVAIFGKMATGLVVFGKSNINRLAIGVGMIPRGEVGLIFAGVGSSIGILSAANNTAIIMMVILTTFLAPPLLRLVFEEKKQTNISSE